MNDYDTFKLDGDFHVHSRFSDGAGSLEQNIAAARVLGLDTLGLVDHVRRYTTWVPEFVGRVRALDAREPIELVCGVEAKILDQAGNLDLPADLSGVQRIVAADHQFPGRTGPVSPTVVLGALASGRIAASRVIEDLVVATEAAMRAHEGLLLAHLFSLLPKMGLDEGLVSDEQIERLAETALKSSAILEISERWRCPSLRVASVFRAAGVPIVPSTDAHAPAAIGRYDYVAAVFLALETERSLVPV